MTFTAPKPAHVLPPGCARVGALHIAAIGSPAALYEADESVFLSLSEACDFAALLAPRDPGGHKGSYGHALVIAGSPGKTGAAALCGFAALRSGAGLVTVASTEEALPPIAAFAPELMTERLPALRDNKDVIAIGPGLGKSEEMQALIRKIVCEFPQPVVIDADALAAMPLACEGKIRILTPHPGEMSRLTGRTTAEIQVDRIGAARSFAMEHKVTVVLKGWRTVIAFPNGRVWINPTGTPAMGKGGSGDVLTGMIAGFLAQFPMRRRPRCAPPFTCTASRVNSRSTSRRQMCTGDRPARIPAGGDACLRKSEKLNPKRRQSSSGANWRSVCRGAASCC